MMIGYKGLDAHLPSQPHRFDSGNPAINRYQKLCAAGGQSAHGVAVETIALIDTMGNIIIHLRPQHLQQMPQNCHTGDAIHIIIAVNGYFFAAFNRLTNARRRFGNAEHLFRRNQVAQFGR